MREPMVSPIGNFEAAGEPLPNLFVLPWFWKQEDENMGKGALLWLLGIPLPIILLLWLFGFLH